MLMTFKIGLMLGLSMIISIGVQNLFVIRQAARNEYPYLSALACSFSDVVLIMLGVTGVSTLLIEIPILKTTILLLGIAFLCWYGFGAIRRGYQGGAKIADITVSENNQLMNNSMLKIILLALTFSFLNPQAVIDTVVIIGGNANQYADQEKLHFIIGAITASFLWFFGLSLTAKFLAHKLTSTRFWQLLDYVSGGLMLGIAGDFVMQLLVVS